MAIFLERQQGRLQGALITPTMPAPPQAPRAVLRKPGPDPPAPSGTALADSSPQEAPEHAPIIPSITHGGQAAEPCILLDADSWQVLPSPAAELLSAANAEFCVVGALGRQGLGKSELLNQLLGFGGELPAAGPQPSPAFPVTAATAAVAARHCTRGVGLSISADRTIALDSQPLFSASVLQEMAAAWAQPPQALLAPAAAAAGESKAGAVPFEGVQQLAQLQLAVLLLVACHRVLLLCDGLQDYASWELLTAAEMLARGVPDPSLPPRDPLAAATPGGGGGSAVGAAPQQQPPRQGPPPQEHVAEVILVHVLPPGQEAPTAEQLVALEARLDAFFSASRLRRPGALQMLDHLPGGRRDGAGQAMSYWVLPALEAGSSGSSSSSSGSDGGPLRAAWAQLVARLLARPAPPFARRCTELQWLRGVTGDAWRAIRKSPDIAAFYSRLARTQLKGAGGWAL